MVAFPKNHTMHTQPPHRFLFFFFFIQHMAKGTFLLCSIHSLVPSLSLSLFFLSISVLVSYRILMCKYWKYPAVWLAYCTSDTCNTYARHFFFLSCQSGVVSFASFRSSCTTKLQTLQRTYSKEHSHVSLYQIRYFIKISHTHRQTHIYTNDACISHHYFSHLFKIEKRQRTRVATKQKKTVHKKNMDKMKKEALRYFFCRLFLSSMAFVRCWQFFSRFSLFLFY